MEPVKVYIPEPCHESWQKMTPSEKGRFCGSCKKQVFDFTKCSFPEITEALNQPGTCGRYKATQVEPFSFTTRLYHKLQTARLPGFIRKPVLSMLGFGVIMLYGCFMGCRVNRAPYGYPDTYKSTDKASPGKTATDSTQKEEPDEK
jgi:hypothetical protein